jgi:hypothetical protein
MSKMQELSVCSEQTSAARLRHEGVQQSEPTKLRYQGCDLALEKTFSPSSLSCIKPAADPAYESIARMLDEDLARAVSSLATGNRDYARLTIRESIGYCIQCHTQTAGGPNFPKLELGFRSRIALCQHRAAAISMQRPRQFDRALESYQSGVSDCGIRKTRHIQLGARG